MCHFLNHKTMNKKEIILARTRHNFIMFSRNGRWGTCVDCPKDSTNMVYPEFCVNTERYDHHLNVDSLAENYKIQFRS